MPSGSKGPYLTLKRPAPIGRGRGRGKGPVTPGPVKPKPSKGKNPQLPYRSADPGFGPKKRPQPVKPNPRKLPKGGSIRDLLYRAKPGEQMKKAPKSTMAKGFDKAKYEQMIQRGQISIMRRPKLNNEKMYKYMDKLKGSTPAKPKRSIFDTSKAIGGAGSAKRKPVMPRRGGR